MGVDSIDRRSTDHPRAPNGLARSVEPIPRPRERYGYPRSEDEDAGSIDASDAAGIHVRCVPWLEERDVAIPGRDAASEGIASRVEACSRAVRRLLLRGPGVPVSDHLDLETIREEGARRGRREVLVTGAPLAVTGRTGSPLRPIGTF